MSMDPTMMQQMLMQQLQQRQTPGAVGGGNAGPAMVGSTTPLNGAAQLAQKAMLVKALQGGTQNPFIQQRQAMAGMPAMQAKIGMDPQMQALQQTPPMDPNLQAQLQQIPQMSQGMPQPQGGGATQ